MYVYDQISLVTTSGANNNSLQPSSLLLALKNPFIATFGDPIR